MRHTNHFETVKEANARLRSTIVLYDGEPYSVVAITDHKGNGVFRIYLMPIGLTEEEHSLREWPETEAYAQDNPALGTYLDDWMESHKTSGLIRKEMDSPKFNKYRPYPLGMCNVGPTCYYVERQPNRKMEQGLLTSMLEITKLSLDPDTKPVDSKYQRLPLTVYSPEFKACVLGDHPPASEVLSVLTSSDYDNTAVGFSRNFAFVRGPIGMIFLAYKTDIIGVLPKSDLSSVRIAKEFRHTKEVVEALNLFGNIEI